MFYWIIEYCMGLLCVAFREMFTDILSLPCPQDASTNPHFVAHKKSLKLVSSNSLLMTDLPVVSAVAIA